MPVSPGWRRRRPSTCAVFASYSWRGSATGSFLPWPVHSTRWLLIAALGNREREHVMIAREDDERPNADSGERLPLGELRPDDRGQDEVREALEESIGRGEPRPLSREEREAAARDPGPAKTVYAPASERVPKPPLPADEKLIDQRKDDVP